MGYNCLMASKCLYVIIIMCVITRLKFNAFKGEQIFVNEMINIKKNSNNSQDKEKVKKTYLRDDFKFY